MSLPEPGPAIFVQPHYDDVPLSCGGTVARLAERGDGPSIVTVFAGEFLDEMVGELAAWKHSRWRLTDPDAVIATRRAEDAAAARTLGCPVRWLGWPDAIYRDRYRSDAELFSTVSAEELEAAGFLADELRGLPEWQEGTRVFVPLGIGSHVDHQLVFEAGRVLAAAGVPVLAYEDCPYAIHTPSGVPARLEQVRGAVGEPVVVPLGDAIGKRIAAIACYQSQLPVIFRFTADFAGAVKGFAEAVGGGLGPAERFWPILPS